MENEDWNPDDGVDPETNQFLSQVLRRLPGLCPPPRADYHDLWSNWMGDGCTIKLEWMNGTPHREILERLLEFGQSPDMEIDLDGYARKGKDDCYAQTEGSVTIRSKRQPRASIVLRRLRDADWGRDSEWTRHTDVELRAERAAIERKHGYRVRRPRSLAQGQ